MVLASRIRPSALRLHPHLPSMKKHLLLLPLLAVCAVTSHGTVFIHETFDGYANPGGDTAALTAPAMTGLTGNWSYISNDSGDTYINRSSTSLTDAFEFYKSSNTIRTVHRDTDTGHFSGIANNESFYASAIFRTADITNGDLTVILDNDLDGTSSDIFFGFSNGSFVAGAVAGANTSGGSLAANTDYRVVIRVTYNISGVTDEISLWVNPTLESDTATISGLQGSIIRGQFSTGGINGITISGQDLGGFTSAFVDDIRVGTTFAEAIPEPSTYALTLSVLAVGAVMLRRRQRG